MATYSNVLTKGSILHGKSYSYCIERTLGQGSFGITYLASVKMQGTLGSIDAKVKVAVKEFFMKEINGREGSTVTSGSKGGLFTEYRKKFVREATNLSKLQHPNIIKVLECFEANNTVYYSMEYLDGGSLDELITKKHGLSEAETVKYTMQIGNALSYMHEHKELHLDLKPGNIMLSKGDAVLIDFGLSKQYDASGNPESSTTVGAGTPGYAPIEQANYHDGKGFPVTMDVYALGATMYKMLTGQRPPNASEILNDGLSIPSSISSYLGDAIVSAMQPMRKNRPQSVKGLLRLLSNNDSDEQTIVDEEATDTFTILKQGKVEKINEWLAGKRHWLADIRHRISVKHILFLTSALIVVAVSVFVKFPSVANRVESTNVNKVQEPNYDVINSIEMVHVKGGSFVMGRSDGLEWDQKHKVTLSDFYIGKTEVTQAQWKAVMGNNPSVFKGDSLPVENVGWDDVHKFMDKLNQITGKKYRLPTESEWEYAANGGINRNGYKYSGANDISDYGWYKKNSGGTTHPVATKLPNTLGIYDMTGNVNEWCSDWYCTYPSEDQVNPRGGKDPLWRHLIRGGGWNDNEYTCELTNRTDGGDNTKHHNALGFRLVLDGSSQTVVEDDEYAEYPKTTYDGKHNGYKWVDLALPSGTKWAVANVGASSPRENGTYYAWGETKPRSSYTENNGTYNSETTLKSENDVATIVMGKGWRMPTEKDFEELISHCKCKNASNGVVFIGKNGHKVFFPFSKYKYGKKLSAQGDSRYWSSSPGKEGDFFQVAITMNLYYDEAKLNQLAGFHGLNVRAVTK